MDDWVKLNEQYSHVAFNWKGFDGKVHSRENGYRIFYPGEPYVGMPENWDLDVLRQYEHVITWNPAFFEMYRPILNMHLVQGVLGCNPPSPLTERVSFEEKINGVCCLNNVYPNGRPGSIYWLRNEVMQNIGRGLVRHVWAPQDRQWGGSCYQGEVEAPIHHSHPNHLRKISEYKFCLCLESSYHPFWTQGFVTERILNCFRAGTIPIYMGCYNIRDYVPEGSFVDFGEFYGQTRDYDGLSTLLQQMSENEAWYEEIVESNHRWVNTCQLGSVAVLEDLIKLLG